MPCSYCRNSEHTINYCDSPSILIHYIRLKNEYERTLMSGLNEAESKQRFINYHLRSGRRYLKAVAIRYAGAVSSWNNTELLEAIWIHFTETGSVPNPGISQIMGTSQNQHINEYIINSMDHEQFEERPLSPIITDQFNILDWFVDRNPSPDGHINVDSPINNINYNVTNYNINFNRQSNINLATVVRNLMNDYNNVELNNLTSISKERRLQMLNIIPILDTTNKIDCENCEDCSICYEEKQNMDKVTLNCGHQFCGECIDKTINNYTQYSKPICALCRAEIKTLNIKNPEIYNTLVDNSVVNTNNEITVFI
jgi:hypothetical protein